MADQDQRFEAYLRCVQAELRDVSDSDKPAIIDELRAHLHDAAAEGKHDPAAVLGRPKQLGRTLNMMHGGRPARPWHWWLGFWFLWAAAGTAGYGLLSNGPYDLDQLWRIAASAAIAAVLQAPLLAVAGRPGLWRRWLSAAAGPWLACALLFWQLPWQSMDEPLSESWLLGALLVTTLAAGVLQWRALRPVSRLAGLIVPVPLLSVIAAFMLSTMVHVAIVFEGPLLAQVGGYYALQRWVALVFGAIYGAIVGAAMVLLVARGPRPQLLSPSIER